MTHIATPEAVSVSPFPCKSLAVTLRATGYVHDNRGILIGILSTGDFTIESRYLRRRREQLF